MKAVVEPSESLKNRSRKPVKESSNGKKIQIAQRLMKVEKATKAIKTSLIFNTSVIRNKIGFNKRKATTVTNKLKRTFPSTIRFLDTFPPIAASIILIVVPVCDPRIIAAAIGRGTAPTWSALKVRAIVTELD